MPGSRWMAEYRVERRPGMEIARQWARSGDRFDAMTEVERLRSVVARLASELRAAGLDITALRAEQDLGDAPVGEDGVK